MQISHLYRFQPLHLSRTPAPASSSGRARAAPLHGWDTRIGTGLCRPPTSFPFLLMTICLHCSRCWPTKGWCLPRHACACTPSHACRALSLEGLTLTSAPYCTQQTTPRLPPIAVRHPPGRSPDEVLRPGTLPHCPVPCPALLRPLALKGAKRPPTDPRRRTTGQVPPRGWIRLRPLLELASGQTCWARFPAPPPPPTWPN